MTDSVSSLDATMESFAHELVVAILNLELHLPQSEAVQSNLRQILADGHELRRQGVAHVRLTFDGDRLALSGQPIIGASLQARKLLNIAAECRIGAIEFDRNLEAPELLRFLMLLTSEQRDAFDVANIERAFVQKGIRQIRVKPRCDTAGESAADGALRGYQDLAECLQDSHVAASRGDSIAVDRAEGVVEQALAQMDREPSSLLSLAYYDDIDSFTVGHSIRVALLALQVARATGCDDGALMRVGTAALLHDIGKSRIPQDVLFKRGPLSDDEWQVMQMHPRLGAEILIEQPEVDPSAIGAAFCHHMADGGKGYPTPVLPFEPSAVSKLVRVCDVFEALTSVRPYKPALPPVEAYAIMHRNPSEFDPKWLEFFVSAIGLYPLGTRLTLSTGESAIVIGQSNRRDQPKVKLTAGPDRAALPADAPTVIDIGSEVDGVTRQIAEVVATQRKRTPQSPLAPGEHQPCC